MTSDSAAYYALVSRLRSAGLPFSSALSPVAPDCDLILTTGREAPRYGASAMALEELDSDPGVFRGQIVSRLRGGTEELLIGVDPGKRIGVVAFYGRVELVSCTLRSPEGVGKMVADLAGKVPSGQVLVRVGGGNMEVAMEILDLLSAQVPGADLELVDESGTSSGSPKTKGVQRDQVAAARIAFRKGNAVTARGTRISSRPPR